MMRWKEEAGDLITQGFVGLYPEYGKPPEFLNTVVTSEIYLSKRSFSGSENM